MRPNFNSDRPLSLKRIHHPGLLIYVLPMLDLDFDLSEEEYDETGFNEAGFRVVREAKS